MSRALTTLFAAVLLAAAAPSAHAAAAPDSGQPARAAAAATVTVDPPVVPRGERAAIRGRGWKPGSRVRLSIGLPQSDAYPIDIVRVNGRGGFVKRVRFRGLPGLYVVVACPSIRCPHPVRTTVRIVKPSRKGQKTLLHTDRPKSRYVERPRKVGYDGFSIPGNLDSVILSRLAWRNWGRGQATATGRARICAAGACRTVGAKAVATRRVRYESREWFYARVVLRLRADAGIGTRRVSLCTLPALCGGRPGPP